MTEPIITETAPNTENFTKDSMEYRKTADTYRITRYILPVLMLIAAVIAAVVGFSVLKPVNFRYIAKNIGLNPYNLHTQYRDISYATGGTSGFSMYRGDLAVCGEGTLALYGLNGDILLRADTEKGMPSVLSEGRYLAVYTPGMKTVRLFNSFDKVHEESFPDSIASVSVSQKGNYAVCLRNAAASSVWLFDADFVKTGEIEIKSGIVMHTAISENGKYLATLSYARENFTGTSELRVYSTATTDMLFSYSLQAQSPVSVSFMKNNSVYAVTDREIAFFTAGGKHPESQPVSDIRFTSCDGCNLLVYGKDGRALLFSESGRCIADFTPQGNVSAVKTKNEISCFLSENTVYAYDSNGNMLFSSPLENDILDFFILDDNSILLCYPSETKRISTNT